MKRFFFLFITFFIFSCSNTRYITDKGTIERQHEMQKHRTGINMGDIIINTANIFISSSLDIDAEIQNSERIYRHIKIINESPDTMHINMVTDVFWENDEYNDILGIELPPFEKQKILVPYPVAYNIYFRTSHSEEEMFEITTDRKRKKVRLISGMTIPTE